MLPLRKLRSAVGQGLAYVEAQSDVVEAELFASAKGNLTVRLNYSSHIPSNGVEEPKSVESFGLGMRALFRTPDGVRVGFGSEPNDISLDGVRRALDKARLGAVADPEFVSLPRPTREVLPPLEKRHDPAIMRLTNGRLLESGWRMVERGLEAFQSSEDLLAAAESPQERAKLGLILGGDVVFLQQRKAVASTHLHGIASDESTMVMSFATAMVERQDAKGSGWSVGTHLADFTGEAAAEAARRAIASMDGRQVPGGAYRVILGPQPVTEILEWILMPGLHLDSFYAGASPFMGKLGQQVASQQLSLYDHGNDPELAGSRSMTDEGLPTGRTTLIREGVLTGLLSDYYNYQRILNDPRGREKLGRDPQESTAAIAPHNGFRTGNAGVGDFASTPSPRATNLVVDGPEIHPFDELLRLVGNGIYIGRIWYTYPINGITAGEFSGTIVGDSYIIENGRLGAPIKPNTLRMNDNALRVINNILGIGSQHWGTVRWSSDQVTWAPAVAVDGFNLEAIGGL